MAEHSGWDHTRALERLVHAFPALGVEPVEYVLEQPVRKHDGSLAGDIDALVRTKSQIVIVEYKVEDRAKFAAKREKKAFRQLDRVSGYFTERLGFRPRSLYIYGPRFVMREHRAGTYASDDLSRIVTVLDPTLS